MSKTLIILKPDCMEKGLAGEVIGRFERAGFAIKACKMTRLSEEILRDHYAHLVQFPFFPSIVEFMRSRPVIIMVLEGPDAVVRVREMLGPTDCRLAPKGTIRGDLGTDKSLNICHASDSDESASAEIARFFAMGEVY